MSDYIIENFVEKMETQKIENIELKFLSIDDYEELKEAMLISYDTMPDAYWQKAQIKTLIDKFPDGQIVIKVNGELAGCAFSIIVNYETFSNHHTYKEITGNYTFYSVMRGWIFYLFHF